MLAETRDTGLVYDISDLEVCLGGGRQRFVVRVPELRILTGDKVCISGESGSGKSTLIDTLAMVRTASASAKFDFRAESNIFHLRAQNLSAQEKTFAAKQFDALRRTYIGYVPQTGGLVAALTVWENIIMPLRLKGLNNFDQACDIARRLGVDGQLHKRPAELSVGQRQRVAIARALAANPVVVAADEPTAALDPLNAETVLAAFTQIVEDFGVALIIVSHSPQTLLTSGFRSFIPVIESRDDEAGVVATFVEE